MRIGHRLGAILLSLGIVLTFVQAASARPRNILLFVADGLRADSVTAQSAPTMWALARRGVSFPNSHSEYPTLTTVNAAAIATGHLPGDTGEFANSMALGYNSACPRGTGTVGPIGPFENNCVLAEANARAGGTNYLRETSVLAAASARGFSTAVIGKLGPAAIQQVASASGRAGSTIVIDDAIGRPEAVPTPPALLSALSAAGLGAKESVAVASRRPQRWFTDVTTRVLLPRFKAAGRPFVLVYWCRDPDSTQHGQKDGPNALLPGINGPSSLAAIGAADGALADLLAALRDQGLEQSTDVIVTADHGFSTVAKVSQSSPSAKGRYAGVPPGELPPGFVARDLARALNLPLYEPSALVDPVGAKPLDLAGPAPHWGDAMLGRDPAAPDVIVAANSGTNLIYLPTADRSALARRVSEALQAQDYTGAVFVRDDLGPIAGTLPFSLIGFAGSARMPPPAIVVSMRTFVSPGCTLGAELCSAVVAEGAYRTGQGTHGSLSRAETHNFMAAAGPSFKTGYIDRAPVGNADWGATMTRLLGLDLKPKGRLRGRVMTEALRGGRDIPFRSRSVRSAPGPGGLVLTLKAQDAGGRTYLDAAGYPGRVVGLP